LSFKNPREEVGNMTVQQRNMEIEEVHVEKRTDSSLVASTFIKYTAYVVITLGILYFLAVYVLPKL
jgi:hypothetical protein